MTLFKIVMASAKTWKDMITAISILVDEASFDITSDNIKLRAMDPSHVAMVDFEWPKSVFDEYICEKPTKLCVNIGEMLKLLKRVRIGESIELSPDEKTGRLNIRLIGKYIRTFSMPTLEAIEEEVPTPKISFNVKTRITSECLKEVMEDASTVSDHIRFETVPEKLTIKAVGDLGSVNIEIEKSSDVLLGLEIKEESKATYSLNYLTKIIKAASAVSDVTTFEYSTDMPIHLDFEMPTGGRLSFWLAPRIEAGA